MGAWKLVDVGAGYQQLRPKDIVRLGDEWLNESSGKWLRIEGASAGSPSENYYWPIFRRKLTEIPVKGSLCPTCKCSVKSKGGASDSKCWWCKS